MKSRKLLNNCYCSEHPEQKLNLVCISSTCPQKGLICSLCKYDPNSSQNIHQQHANKIVPFKHLINSLESSFQNNKDFDGHTHENLYVKKLQGFKSDCLFILEDTVKNLAKYIEDLEQKIIDEYETARSGILYRGETVRRMKKVIQRSVLHDIRKQQKFQLINEMKTLVSFIRDNETKQFGPRYELNISPHNIVASFMQIKENLISRCTRFQMNLQHLNILPFEEMQEKYAELKVNKKEKKQKKKHQIFEKQAEIVEELKDFSISVSEISQIHEVKSQVKQEVSLKSLKKKEEELPKAKKPLKKKEDSKEISKLALLSSESFSKISKPIKDKILDFVPILSQESSILEKKEGVIEEQKVKKSKAQKSFELISSLIDDKSSEEENGGALFSTIYKNPTIKLIKNGKTAKQIGEQGFALISENIAVRPSISFKLKLKNHIILGVTLLTKAQQFKFGPFSNKIANHPMYGLDEKGVCYLSNNHEENNVKKPFSFEDRDIINIKYEDENLWFQKTVGKKNHKNSIMLNLKVKFQEQMQKKLYFCAYLGGKDDNVQIV